jgi:hypothetical protein
MGRLEYFIRGQIFRLAHAVTVAYKIPGGSTSAFGSCTRGDHYSGQ